MSKMRRFAAMSSPAVLREHREEGWVEMEGVRDAYKR
jgi:hypothetical protein